MQSTAGNRAVRRSLATIQREEAQAAAPEAAASDAVATEGATPAAAGGETGPANDYLTDAPADAAEPLSDELYNEMAPRVPATDGHSATVQIVDGEVRLGMESDFTDLLHIIDALTSDESPLDVDDKALLVVLDLLVRLNVAALQAIKDTHDEARAQMVAASEAAVVMVPQDFGPPLRRRNLADPTYVAARARAEELWAEYQAALAGSVDLARSTILDLWQIGADFLPTYLMPRAEVYKDKAAFRGDTDHYTYHTGAADDPIPIAWYKPPAAYPMLRLPTGEIVTFGEAFKIGGVQFGLADENTPALDWRIQKTAHNETREGQAALNRVLIENEVQVSKGGRWVRPAVGNTHQFDGDHVKDLGFGGADRANNYWPLDSTINRRAFTGYNANYVINYLDGATPKSRAIGGLVGKWFIVSRFMGAGGGSHPDEGAAAGGTPK
ncbi:MAG: hypothetical protein AB7F65_05880 [Dehalococcoidia bacterium]